MTQEEKAKCYDNIIEKANKMHSENCEACQMCIEELIPELRESEDERIRKELIAHFKTNSVSESWSGLNVKKVIAWLEKQGKKEWSKEMGSLCLEACSLLRDYLEGVPSNSPLAQKIKKAEAFLGDLYHEEFFPNTYNPRPDIISPEWSDKDETIIKTMCNEGNLKPSEIRWLNNLCYRVKQQKPAEWSEEDETIVNKILSVFDKFKEAFHGCKIGSPIDIEDLDKIGSWLKSLKCRVQIKPQQEWNGSDDAHLHSIITHLQDFIESHPNTTCADIQGENVAWLKSIRPQSQWKPSDEQMDMLKIAVSTSNSIVLDSLYNDLMKLKG